MLLLLALLAWIPSCGTKRPPPVKWQEAMQVWFANSSVSPPEPPRQLWSREDEELFLRRIGFADVVAIGTIRVVTLFSRFEQHNQISVAFRPSEVLYGELKDHLSKAKELYCRLGPADLDFQMALRVQEHLPGTKYVLLLKLKPDERRKKQPPVLRWSLYRPDKRLLAEIRGMYKWLEKKDDDGPKEIELGDKEKGDEKGDKKDDEKRQ